MIAQPGDRQTCECGHSIREHSMSREAWDLDEFSEGPKGRTGNGHCFHFNFPLGGFCWCLHFVAREEVAETCELGDDPAYDEPSEARS
jgi:hypothetical protein